MTALDSIAAFGGAFLAQLTPGEIGQSVRNYSDSADKTRLVPFLLAGAAVLAAILIVMVMVHLVRERRKPLALFHDLAAHHGLPRAWTRQLLRLSRSHGLSDPALLFVCPNLVKQLLSLEVSEARGDKERRRIEAFFSRFTAAVYG